MQIVRSGRSTIWLAPQGRYTVVAAGGRTPRQGHQWVMPTAPRVLGTVCVRVRRRPCPAAALDSSLPLSAATMPAEPNLSRRPPVFEHGVMLFPHTRRSFRNCGEPPRETVDLRRQQNQDRVFELSHPPKSRSGRLRMIQDRDREGYGGHNTHTLCGGLEHSSASQCLE